MEVKEEYKDIDSFYSMDEIMTIDDMSYLMDDINLIMEEFDEDALLAELDELDDELDRLDELDDDQIPSYMVTPNVRNSETDKPKVNTLDSLMN